MKNILLVEDNMEMYKLVEMAIGTLADIEYVQTLKDAREALANKSYDIILLDLTLPDGSGIDLCTKIISEDPLQSVYILSANDSLPDKVLGFTAGAEDYITKPFNSLEFRARIESKLKRLNSQMKSEFISKWDELEIDKAKQKIMVKNCDKNEFETIKLTGTEFKLLNFLADQEDMIVKRDDILTEIWGSSSGVRSVDTHISKLRRKLKSAARYIKSIHGVGYKFTNEKV